MYKYHISYAGYGGRVVVKCCDSFIGAAKVSKIPNLNQTVVTAGHYKWVIGVPVDDIDIRGVCVSLCEHTSFTWVCTNVPDFQRFVDRARHKHVRLIGAPSDVLNTGVVRSIGFLTDRPGSTSSRSPDVDTTSTVPRGKGTRGYRTPVQSEAFCPVTSKGL